MSKIYDLIIIGAGPAGITASVYAARQKMDFLIITKDIGGQVIWSGGIENYTGYQFITGMDLIDKFEEHMKKYDVKVKEDEEVKSVEKDKELIVVATIKDEYKAKTVIITSGKRPKTLNIPGETEFKNKGLTYCATCDGPLFSDKDVAVIGGGNSALDSVLQLIKIANHIYLVNNTSKLTGDKMMQDKIKASDKVTVFNNSELISISGKKMVEEIKIKTGEEKKTLSVQGVFVEIGLIPNSEFMHDIEKNKRGEIIINCASETSIPNIFAAGDVTDVPEKQIIVAAGDGAKAALGVFKYISGH